MYDEKQELANAIAKEIALTTHVKLKDYAHRIALELIDSADIHAVVNKTFNELLTATNERPRKMTENINPVDYITIKGIINRAILTARKNYTTRIRQYVAHRKGYWNERH